MNIRIISGQFGGRKIDAPDGTRTHPMSERVRNALFNMISGELAEAVVLDAFAGTGSLGLEALSRGAAEATFVERDKLAGKILAKNIETLGCGAQAKLIYASVSSWLSSRKAQQGYDIIFADPPYHDVQLSTVKKLFRLLKPGGLMILSHPGRGEAPTEMGVVVVDNRSYGTATLTLYRREDTQ